MIQNGYGAKLSQEFFVNLRYTNHLSMLYTPSLGHILIVDNDVNIAELLRINLKSEGYCVEVVDSASTVEATRLDEVSLIIVDAMDQPYNGVRLISAIKANPQIENIGIILCTTFRSERVIVESLDAGADDVVIKPFSLREMVARIKAILRRRNRVSHNSNILRFDTLTVDLITTDVKIEDRPVSLTKTEYAILTLLLKNIDNYVSRAEIHRTIWDNDNAGTNERIVDTNISRLRKKLGDIGNRIVNRSGHGYMIS